MIKKHRNKNDYCLAGGLWIRNFTKKHVKAADINSLITPQDMQLMLDNESENHSKMLQRIDTESLDHNYIAIVNDGAGFERGQQLLHALPPEVVLIGVNETMKLWNNGRHMHYYVANDPYETCMNFVQKQEKVWPKCIVSSRTYPEFVSKQKGLIYEYAPTPDGKYTGLYVDAEYHIDDYRSAVCAAVGLAYKFNVRKLLLLWCFDGFDHQRPGTAEANGLWFYPQQKLAHQLVDGNLYWLKEAGVKLGYHSRGLEYKHAAYIAGDYITRFFAE